MRDCNFSPSYLITAMATPDRGAIGSRQQAVRFHCKSQRLIVTGCQIADDCICGTRNHEVSDPIDSLIEREAEMPEMGQWMARG